MAANFQSGHDDGLQGTVTLLGGPELLGCQIADPYQAHRLIVAGLPIRTALHLIRTFRILQAGQSGLAALGVSRRTIQRWHQAPATRRLSRAQSERIWILAESLTLTTRILGSRHEAENWLESRIPALNHRRPIELLATSMGAKLVGHHLQRVERGVYT